LVYCLLGQPARLNWNFREVPVQPSGLPQETVDKIKGMVINVGTLLGGPIPQTWEPARLAEEKAKVMWAYNNVPLNSPEGRLFGAAMAWLEGEIPAPVVTPFLVVAMSQEPEDEPA